MDTTTETETARLIIDPDTALVAFDAGELHSDHLRAAIDAIAERVEAECERRGIVAEVERDYRTTGRRDDSTSYPEIFDAVLIDGVDALRAEVLGTYIAHAEGVEQPLRATTLEAALVEAREWMLEGDYTGALDDMRQAARPRTVHDHLRIDCGGETVHSEWVEVVSIEAAIAYAEPRCEDPDGHDWHDHRSTRSTGGLHYYFSERCDRCGMERVRHSDGQAMVSAGQSSEWVEYVEADEDEVLS